MANETPFVNLHLHTDYSKLDGTIKVKELPEICSNLNQTAVAMTDHGNVSGSYEFFKQCTQKNIKPIIGMEAYYTINERSIREIDDLGKSYYHLILLALNNTGLHNLFKISSYAYTEGMYRKPRIDDALLAEYSEGICATTACLGSRVSQLILKDDFLGAKKIIDHHRAMFSNRFLIELQLHEMEEQQKVNKALLEIAKTDDIPIILTNDCHYVHQHLKEFHEISLCLQTNAKLSDEKRFTFGPIDVHLGSHDWMTEQAIKQKIPYEAISNTIHVADMVDSDSYFMDRMNRYPKFNEIPEGFKNWTFLEVVAKEGLFERFNGMPPLVYQERLDYELNSIKKMGFADYMLIVAQLMNGARSEGVLHGPGRGSAAGSLVAYALKITEVDPIQYGLIFERFLNQGRGATPLLFNKNMADSADQFIKEKTV